MTVEITCPNCNFKTTIPKEKIPARARWANCPRCKSRFELALPASPAGSLGRERPPMGAGEPGRGPSPWESRSELGIFRSIYETLKKVMFAPKGLFRSMASGGGIKEPFAFGLLFGSLGMMFALFWQFLTLSGLILSRGGDLINESNISLIFFVVILVSPLFVIAGMFFTSAILHVCLLMVGAGKNGFEATFRVVAYSQATQILGVIPFVGGVLGWFWQLMVQFIGVREIHETSYWRVFLASFIPLAFIILVVVLVMLLFLLHRSL